MSRPLFVVDAFAAQPFSGNPAAVCLLDEPASESWMQRVAAEMNLSETAFLVAEEGAWRLRWFTPATEVDLCGHATLASAHVLWESGAALPAEGLKFATRSGTLGAARVGDRIGLDFPADPPEALEPVPAVEDCLGGRLTWFGRGRSFHFAEIGSEEELRSLKPDFPRLQEVIPFGICVTSRGSGSPYDFYSRFFAPGAGIDEDPVTGAAHCCLAPYWGPRTGKVEMLGYQASRRGGEVRVELDGARVSLQGRAVTVLRGELL